MPKPVFDGERTIIKLKPGDYIEDCRYHPCIVISVTHDDLGNDSSIHMFSLVSGNGYCDARYCGIRLIDPQELATWLSTVPPLWWMQQLPKLEDRYEQGVTKYWESQQD